MYRTITELVELAITDYKKACAATTFEEIPQFCMDGLCIWSSQLRTKMPDPYYGNDLIDRTEEHLFDHSIRMHLHKHYPIELINRVNSHWWPVPAHLRTLSNPSIDRIICECLLPRLAFLTSLHDKLTENDQHLSPNSDSERLPS